MTSLFRRLPQWPAVLERSTLGVPHSALPLLLTAVLVVLLAAAAVPWWSRSGVPAILGWLSGSGPQEAMAAVTAAGKRPAGRMARSRAQRD
jgi:hypothetical protein